MYTSGLTLQEVCHYGICMRITLNATVMPGPYRKEVLHGREYTVVPMTLVVPGVLDGSNGPILYEEHELAKDPSIWNGIPLIAYHPEVITDNGEVEYPSARDPRILNNSGIGFNFNTRYSDNALRSEGWFDNQLVMEYDKRLPKPHRIMPRLINGTPIEISTGLNANNIPHEGNHNGTPYAHIARDYKADHIAILPDQQGACSIKDGCGTSISAQVNNCRYNYRGRCINCNKSRGQTSNCGGRGGKPGPCPTAHEILRDAAKNVSERKPVFPHETTPYNKSSLGISRQQKVMLPEQDVPIEHISTVQRTINPDKVKHFVEGGDSGPAVGEPLAPGSKFVNVGPWAVKTPDGRYYLEDGNHRAAADVLKGKQTVKLRVVEIGHDGKWVHTPKGDIVNCGGKGGKPGPCGKGSTAKASAKSGSKSKPAQKPSTPSKQKAFRNPAEANKLSDEADKASAAANTRYPTPSSKEGGVGVVPHETAMKEYKAKQEAAATAHDRASTAHGKLASSNHPNSSRHSQIAEHHKAMAQKYRSRATASHNRSSNLNTRDTKMDKQKLIQWLTVNCDCWKGKEKILENLEDDDLKELRNQGIAKRITNAAAAGFKGAYTTNADTGEGEVAGIDYQALADFFQIDTDPAKDPIGFTKALKGKLQEVMDALTDAGDPEDAPPPKGDGGADEAAEKPTTMALNDDGEETVVKNAMDDCGPNGKKEPNMNKNRKLTPAQFKEMMPDQFRDAWDDFVVNSRNERESLLKRIAHGLKGGERETIINAHKNMKLPELRLIVKRLGGSSQNNNSNGSYLPEDNLPTFGAGSGYNPNASSTFDENDVFDVPTNTFTRNERFKAKKPNHLTDTSDE